MKKKEILPLVLAVSVIAVFFLGCTYQPPAESNQSAEINGISINDVDIGLENATGGQAGTLPETNEETGEGEESTGMVVGQENGVTTVTVTEGGKVKVSPEGTDPDGDPLTYTFTRPLDANGEWQTKEGDAGRYAVTITASDGKSETKQNIIVIVTSRNKAPVLEPIKDISVKEGDTVEFNPDVSDPDGDDVTVAYSGWMTSNSYKTKSGDAGEHTVTVTVSDGTHDVIQNVKVTVAKVNRAPTISKIPDVQVKEGEKAVAKVVTSDPDGDAVTVTFDNYFDSKGEWQTKEGDSGTYEITATASDGKLETTASFMVTVTKSNNPPTMEKINDKDLKEGGTVKFIPVTSDADGDTVTVTYSGWMASDTYTTDYDDQGTHTVTVTASDGKDEVSQEVTITVEDVNRPPQFCVFC